MSFQANNELSIESNSHMRNDENQNSSCDYIFEELQHAFIECYQKLIKIIEEKCVPKNQLDSLQSQLGEILFEKSNLELQVDAFSKEIDSLKSLCDYQKLTIEKFTKGSIALDAILDSQRLSLDKRGIGYNHNTNRQNISTHFVKASSPHTSSSPMSHESCSKCCTYCEKHGHTVNKCPIKRKVELGSLNPYWERPRWVVKDSPANTQGPKGKNIWVPKT